jgi:hypothetical protein
MYNAEPVFVNFYGARNRFREIDFFSLRSLPGRYDKEGCRNGPLGCESIPSLLKMFTNTGSVCKATS